jgi:hypothetical protein
MRIGHYQDGHSDLLLADKAKNQITLLPGNGKGGFGKALTFGVGAAPAALAVGDLNGDGKLDIVVADFSVNNVSVLLGNGRKPGVRLPSHQGRLAPSREYLQTTRRIDAFLDLLASVANPHELPNGSRLHLVGSITLQGYSSS